MARRKRVEPPTPEELNEIEAGFARETSGAALGLSPPIAQVARDAATQATPGPVADRAAAAKTEAEAESWRAAHEAGLVILQIPTSAVVADEMTRDRMAFDPEEMQELKTSILANGLRMPIEVFKQRTETSQGDTWGLLSGYRRLTAVRQLHAETNDTRFATIRALVRTPETLGDAFAAMVEENEIRSDLSQYERGRIAVLAVGQVGFPTLDDAIAKLFSAASTAKRSKVKSFALIHEELGDLLVFPRKLSERQGLRIAAALKAGLGPRIREALSEAQIATDVEELAVIEPWLQEAEAQPKVNSRGGRPKVSRLAKPRVLNGEVALPNGMSFRIEHDGSDYLLRFRGRTVSAEMMDEVAQVLRRTFDC